MYMSNPMDRNTPYVYLLIFSCFTLVCVHGRGQDFFPSCHVGVLVKRGTTWKTAPQQRLTVRCPVKHCGESLNVTWCKLLDKCEQINYTENVEITQSENHRKDELISFLTFKRISIHDDGLYRCVLEEHGYKEISHTINISVSDLNEGFEYWQNNEDELPGVAGGNSAPWLPYFTICVIAALLVATLIVVTLLSFYGWERILTNSHTKGQEMSTHMIPGLPRGSAPSTPVLLSNVSILNDIYCLSTAERPPSQPPLMNQPAVTNVADEGQVSNHAVYAVINRQQSGIPAREQRTLTEENKNTEYATIKCR